MATKKQLEPIHAPSGFKEISGDRAPVWKPAARGETINGFVKEVRPVSTTKGKKKIKTNLMVLEDESGAANAVWMSASLTQVLGDDPAKIKGRYLMIAYEGLVKMKGRQAMKQFRVFERDGGKKKK